MKRLKISYNNIKEAVYYFHPGAWQAIDKQKALRRDCIYNIENTDEEIGVLGVNIHLRLILDFRHRLLQSNGTKVIIQRSW